MSELRHHIDAYLAELARANFSPQTIRAYESDLDQFLHFLSPPELQPPAPESIDVLLLREWLAALYRHNLSATTIRRKLSAIRGLFRFLLRQGAITVNVARLMRTPKAHKMLPSVMTAEQVNALIEGVASNEGARPYPVRDCALFELLYGCGLRVSEVAAANLEDLDRAEGWLRVRGKGRKERLVPFLAKRRWRSSATSRSGRPFPISRRSF